MGIARFVIHHTSNNQYRFNLIAADNEVLLTSETFTDVRDAKNAIASVRTAAQADTSFYRLTSAADEHYFTLVASNNKVLGTSEIYSSAQARAKGMDAVRQIASSAEVIDGRGSAHT